MKKPVAIVTGGAGFIGSHLTDRLIEENYEVIVLDNLSTGKKANVNSKAIFINMDISRHGAKVIEQKRPDVIFHLAAQAKIPWCTEHPVASFDINARGTLNLLEAAREFKVKAFVYSSSSSVYGEVAEQEPIKEDTCINPISLYALQKYTSERLCTLYARNYGLPTVSLRYFNVYGTNRQSADGAYPNVFSAFIRDYREKGKVTIYGNGKQRRDFIHVYDVVDANIKAMELLNKKHSCYYGSVFNIGTGKAVSINDIAKRLGYRAIHKPARAGDPRYSCADISFAEKGLEFEPLIDLDSGIKILLKSYEKR